MRRRDFLSTSIAAAMMQSGAYGRAFAGKEPGLSAAFSAPVAEPKNAINDRMASRRWRSVS